MNPVFFVRTTESYEVSLVTISRQTSYNSGILCQDYEIVRGMPMDHTRFAYWVTIWIVHLTGLIAASDQTVRAILSCNSWFIPLNILGNIVIRIVRKMLNDEIICI